MYAAIEGPPMVRGDSGLTILHGSDVVNTPDRTRRG
jgi:hypothetical protein